ncbi:tyrosine-protein phosphatase [Halocola ammonii]
MGFLKRLFGKEQLEEPLDFSAVKADMHSHLIPGIDDGAPDLETSISLIKGLTKLGFQKIITTPHVMSDLYKNDSETILRGRDQVIDELRKRNMNVGFEAAAEYYLDDHFEKLIEKKDILSFGDNYVLFELSFLSEPASLMRAAFDLQMAGYKPVLAHPERYNYWHSNPEKYIELSEKGLLLQLNLNSLAGLYNPKVKKIAEYMIDHEVVDFVGTDCHNGHHLDATFHASRVPHLHKLIESKKVLNHTL